MQRRLNVRGNAELRKLGQPFSGALPIAIIAVAGLFAWGRRDQLGNLFKSLVAAIGTGTTPTAPMAENVPDDYDWNRPSVSNSTAMAGPRNGAGTSSGIDGGSMGTDLGTQGEGAR